MLETFPLPCLGTCHRLNSVYSSNTSTALLTCPIVLFWTPCVSYILPLPLWCARLIAPGVSGPHGADVLPVAGWDRRGRTRASLKTIGWCGLSNLLSRGKVKRSGRVEIQFSGCANCAMLCLYIDLWCVSIIVLFCILDFPPQEDTRCLCISRVFHARPGK